MTSHPATRSVPRLPFPFRQFWQAARRVARGGDDAEGDRRLWWMLRALYAFVSVATLIELDIRTIPDGMPARLIWPVVWLPLVPWAPFHAALRAAGWLVPAVAALRPRSSVWRWLTLGVQVIYLATVFSERGMAHRYYVMLVALVFAALLPSPRPASPAADEEARRSLRSDLVWACLAWTLLFYSMSGTTKLIGIAETLYHGDGFFFDFSLPPKQLWDKAYSFQPPPRLSLLVLEHPATAKLGYFAAVAVELFSFPAAFSRRLLRPWLALLASFHLATFLTMKIFFAHAFVILLIYLFLSPVPSPLRWPHLKRRQ